MLSRRACQFGLSWIKYGFPYGFSQQSSDHKWLSGDPTPHHLWISLEVFEDAGLANFLDAVLDGYHATVFAYGGLKWGGHGLPEIRVSPFGGFLK